MAGVLFAAERPTACSWRSVAGTDLRLEDSIERIDLLVCVAGRVGSLECTVGMGCGNLVKKAACQGRAGVVLLRWCSWRNVFFNSFATPFHYTSPL